MREHLPAHDCRASDQTNGTTGGDRVNLEPSRLKVFISYARSDGSHFADWLEAALKSNGFDAYIDRKDIAPGEPWRERLGQLIWSADAVVFVVTPRSVASEICQWEAEEAAAHGKRIVPAVLQPVPDKHVPAQISRVNYIVFHHPSARGRRQKWEAGVRDLCAVLHDHIPWAREQTRLEELALGWELGGRPEHRLLAVDAVVAAEEWRAKRPANFPAVPAATEQFIRASAGRTRFTADEALFAHDLFASGAGRRAQKVARNFLIHCLREGLPLGRAERAAAAGRPLVDLYGDLVADGPGGVASAAWRRLAKICDRQRTVPSGVTSSGLLRVIFDPAQQQFAEAAASMLRHCRLKLREAHEVARFIDPFSEPASQQPGPWPQLQGRFELFSYLLDAMLLSDQLDVCSLLHGPELGLASDADWWAIYYRALLREMLAGRVDCGKVRLRFAQGIQASRSDIEQAIGISMALSEQPRLAKEWSGTLNELIVLLRRHRQRAQRPALLLRLYELLTPIQPKGAFLEIAAAAGTFASSELQAKAARALGCSAQTEDDLVFLLDRFCWERSPALKSLLFQALVESTATFRNAAVGMAHVAAQAASAYDVEAAKHAVHQLSASLQASVLKALVAGEALPSACGELRVGLLAQTLIPEIEGLAAKAPETAFAALSRLFAAAVPEAISAAQLAGTEFSVSPVCVDSPAEVVLAEWDRFCTTKRPPEWDRLATAEATQAQFRWVKSLLDAEARSETAARAPAPLGRLAAGLESGTERDGLADLHGRLREWFVRFYDLPGIVQEPHLPAYRDLVTEDPIFAAIEALLDKAGIAEAIDALEPATGLSRSATIKETVANFRAAEASYRSSGAIEQVEVIVRAMVRVLGKAAVKGGDIFLMRALARNNVTLVPGETYAAFEDNLAAALARAYRENPGALVDNLARATLMDEARLKVLACLQAETGAVAAALAERLDAMLGEPTMERAALSAFAVLGETAAEVALGLARRHLARETQPRVRQQLFEYVLRSPLPEDETLAFRSALADRELRGLQGDPEALSRLSRE